MASLEELRDTRIQKIEKLKAAGMDPYTADSFRTHTIAEASTVFDTLSTSGESVTLAGRVLAIRGQGGLLFFNFTDGTGTFQGMVKKEALDETLLALFVDTVDNADFIEVTGTLIVTKTGQQTILIQTWRMLTKALAPLPDKWHGLQDQEERFRKRYLDILTDPAIRELFEKKSKFWDVTRTFMKECGFMEVETPTLEVTTGGAEANPFKTHHKDFDIDVYLRISVGELWQKRLMAAGFPKTFEIGRVYRNEGSSPEHTQEFTNMEFYWAYANYEDGMNLVQDLYRTIATEVFGTTKFTTRGHTFDFAEEWPRVDYADEVLKRTGINVFESTEEEMKAKLDELGVSYEGESRERLMDTLWKYCRKQISGPAFLVHHPVLVSPLSKVLASDPRKTERFQPLIAGSEVGNGFSELNDPIDQRARFELQQKLIERGEEEAMMPEWEFVEMLEHGMPPTCGFGFGERLFAFMVDKPIREIQLFPLMRPKDSTPKKKETMIAAALINVNAGLLKWQEMNTVAHLNAAFGARVGRELFSKDVILSQDEQKINLNIKNAIMIRAADSAKVLREVALKAKEEGLQVDEFTREMLETTNDKKITEITAAKPFEEIEYLGVLVYGPKEAVEEIVKEFPLFS
ncbi:MAG: lysine--tRNA ligase [Candidatus Pacebacteria bacterium]|jgi:lysyl-tRNA synthetase class 2|nr:lysine--tRNA ligase [Candidatus Paceibacterota bacterium]